MSVPELASRFASATVTSICSALATARATTRATGQRLQGRRSRASTAAWWATQWSGVRLAELLPAIPRLRNLTGDNLHIIFEGADGYESSTRRRWCSATAPTASSRRMNGDAGGRPRLPCRAPPASPARARQVAHRDPAERDAVGGAVERGLLSPVGRRRGAGAAAAVDHPAAGAARGGGGARRDGRGAGRRLRRGDQGGRGERRRRRAGTRRRAARQVLKDDATAPHHWLRWTAQLPLGVGGGALRCRASDADGGAAAARQHKHKGYLYNGWSRVEVTVTPSEWMSASAPRSVRVDGVSLRSAASDDL